MRGSPYFKAFEVEVCDWETQLARIQSILEIWLRVQHHWLYLEPIFTTEDIIMQMPAEAKMFKDVDTCWRNVMELVDQVWSLTQFYSVDFSKSRIGVSKCVFNKRTIKVCVSCC